MQKRVQGVRWSYFSNKLMCSESMFAIKFVQLEIYPNSPPVGSMVLLLDGNSEIEDRLWRKFDNLIRLNHLLTPEVVEHLKFKIICFPAHERSIF